MTCATVTRLSRGTRPDGADDMRISYGCREAERPSVARGFRGRGPAGAAASHFRIRRGRGGDERLPPGELRGPGRFRLPSAPAGRHRPAHAEDGPLWADPRR